jgi:hypothetical protein
MAVISFDKEAFITAFPVFKNIPPPDLELYWDFASQFISDTIQACTKLSVQTRYLQLMTAHLLQLNSNIEDGNTPGVVIGATIDKVSVQIQPPPEKNQWQYWLNQTPYGQQLLALLQVQSVGGFYIGGSPERLAFRGPGGFY